MSWLRCLGGFDLDSFRKDSKSLKVSSRLHLIRGKLDREASDSDTLSVLLVDQKTILLNHHEILARQEMYWHVYTKSRYPNPNPEYLWTSMIARHFKKWGHIYKVKVTGGPRSTLEPPCSRLVFHTFCCTCSNVFASISSQR